MLKSFQILLLCLVCFGLGVAVEATSETEKIEAVVSKLEANADGNSSVSITFEEAKEALDEVESWWPRAGIRLKRAKPLINCAEWLIRPVVFGGKAKESESIKKMFSSYNLFRDQCKRGLVDYFIAHGDLMQGLANSLFWGLDKAPELTKQMIDLAGKEYQNHYEQYMSLSSDLKNFDEIEWILQYMNSRAARVIVEKIIPLSATEDFVTLKDVFTDEMRFMGNFIELGQQHYYNYDIDVVPLPKRVSSLPNLSAN